MVRRRVVFGAAWLVAVAGCDSTAPRAGVVIVYSEPPIASTVGAPLETAPHFEIRDARGNPVGGIPFTVHTGTASGTVQQVFSRTVAGPTTVGIWTLGTLASVQTVTIESPGFEPLTIAATARAGAPAHATPVNTPLVASVRAGAAFLARPTIRVTDEFGNPDPNTIVTVSVTGGGTVEQASPVTNSDGIATVGTWTLGSLVGSQTLTLTAGAAPPVVFTANATEPFNVTLRYIGTPPSAAAQQAFTNAAQRVQRAIVNGLPSQELVNFSAASACGGSSLPVLTETVDDLLLLVEVLPLDGVGGLLGQAGPCAVRVGSQLPYLGIMQFDVADVNNMVTAGTFGSVALHEMHHVLGFGTLWPSFGLLNLTSGSNPLFTAGEARTEYVAAGGTVANAVPVEAGGGTGTALSHWRESVFRDELMTGFLTGASQPYSRITIASLIPLGYTVDLTAADPYTVTNPLLQAGAVGAPAAAWERLIVPSLALSAKR
ncbi:MAG TPA: leishmanolysin-related zinc metalloendopeptidase [Gemmatimonadaceae bacterium]|nr:leishmanolysin-related zinc metalloendopeptidase [Gemmatimonadaceae bacterium]